MISVKEDTARCRCRSLSLHTLRVLILIKKKGRLKEENKSLNKIMMTICNTNSRENLKKSQAKRITSDSNQKVVRVQN